MRSTQCAAHKHDCLVPVESHHVWPLGYHGPNTKANQRQVCANAHSDIHYLLEAMLKNANPDRRTYGPGVRALAESGYEQVMAYAEQLSKEYA